MKCSKCGFETPENLEFCPICGENFYAGEEPTVLLNTDKMNELNTKNCPFCGASLRIEAMFCNSCGKSLNTVDDTPKCRKCGSPLREGANFCGVCGNSVVSHTEETIYSVPKKAPAFEDEKMYSAAPAKKGNGTMIWIIVLIAVILICGGIIAFLLIDNSSDPVPSSSPQPIQTQDDDKSLYHDDEENEKEETEEKEKTSEEEETAAEEPSQDERHGIGPFAPVPTSRPIPQDGYSIPDFVNISASSVRAPMKGFNYVAANVTDDRWDTSWTEGVNGHGIGESLTFFAPDEQMVSGIKILNGYCKSEKLYYENNRIKKIQISFSNGSIYTYTLSDYFGEYNIITFDEPEFCTSVKLSICEVYEGSKYDDTCITEAAFF